MVEYVRGGLAKSRARRRTTYFCRLCREYGIINRKAHLERHHNASHDTVSKRSSGDLVGVIFVESADVSGAYQAA